MDIFKSLRLMLAVSVYLAQPGGAKASDLVQQPDSLPKALQNIPTAAISRFNLSDLHSAERAGGDGLGLLSQASDGKAMQLRLPQADGVIAVQVTDKLVHDNGDITVWGVLSLKGKPHQVLLTQGKAGAIGEIAGASGHSLLLQQHEQLYLVNLQQAALSAPSYEHDVVMPAFDTAAVTRAYRNSVTQQHGNKTFTIVDIMMLYASDVAEQYPDGLADTLMNQLVVKANQAFVDSDIDVQLRLVHRQFVNYSQPSNFDALEDLRFALDGNAATQTDSSLSNVAALREQYGADIVSMIRVHNLNERGVCGVAYFPQAVADIVINISNVGISGGSNCIDTFTHEIGHNFGAGHQFRDGKSVGAQPAAGAYIVPGKFNTVMSSIGTGDVNRN